MSIVQGLGDGHILKECLKNEKKKKKKIRNDHKNFVKSKTLRKYVKSKVSQIIDNLRTLTKSAYFRLQNDKLGLFF